MTAICAPRPLKHVRYPWEPKDRIHVPIVRKPLPPVPVGPEHPNLPFPFGERNRSLATGGSDRVTVCIAAVCETLTNDPKVILCADTRMSAPGLVKYEMGFKFGWAARGIHAMIADEPARAKELLATYWAYLNGVQLTPENVADEIKKPPMQYKRKLIDEYVRLNWGVSYDDYLAGALNNLPQDTLSGLAQQIAAIRLRCQLILTPFVNGQPKLFTVEDDGTTIQHDNFAVIGSGSWIAQSNMLLRQHLDTDSLARTLYCVHESKHLSESETSVGPKTLMVVANRTLSRRVSPRVIEQLFEYEHEYAPKRIPENGIVLEGDLYELLTDEEQGNRAEPTQGTRQKRLRKRS